MSSIKIYEIYLWLRATLTIKKQEQHRWRRLVYLDNKFWCDNADPLSILRENYIFSQEILDTRHQALFQMSLYWSRNTFYIDLVNNHGHIFKAHCTDEKEGYNLYKKLRN